MTCRTATLAGFSLAALLNFYDGKFTGGDYAGERQGQAYPIRDNADVLAIISAAWRASKDAGALAATLLADSRLWGEDLTRIAGLQEQVAHSLARIKAVGVKAAMAELSG